MAMSVVGQPSTRVGQPVSPVTFYASILKPSAGKVKPIPLKLITYQHGEPIVLWDQHEVEQMIINENLQYAIIDKFSYK